MSPPTREELSQMSPPDVVDVTPGVSQMSPDSSFNHQLEPSIHTEAAAMVVTDDAIRVFDGDTADAVLAIRTPANVDRKKVSGQEAALATLVLTEWNQQTGQQLKAADWTGKIIRRLREHPDLALQDHVHVIVAALADPWWK